MSALHLPVAGLPEGVGRLSSGDTALVLCADLDSREGLMRSLLENAQPGQRVTWVCAPSRLPPNAGLARQGAGVPPQLQLLTWTEDAALQVRELGPTRVLRELLSSGMRARDWLVIDALDPWLAQTPEDCALEAGLAEAMRCLLHWSRDHRGPVLALAPAQRRGQDLLPLLACSSVPHLATLRIADGGGQLEVLRWGAARPAGTGGHGDRFELAVTDHGAWQCRSSTALDLRHALAAPDRATVHAVAGALHDADTLAQGWHVHASVAALIAAASEAVGATVVLAYENPDSLPLLADAVHRLRREHPHLLKIVVRETGAAMRRNGELALIRLGANAILERRLGFAQLVALVRERRDETYARTPAASTARILHALAPDPVQGYLAPLAFCAAVERMIERTADLPLEHSLVQLPLLPNVAYRDALLACTPRRDGDLVSADDRRLVLFFFGCPADDAMAALDSVFDVPCSELVQHVQIDPDRHSQRLALAALRKANARAAPDIPALLQGAGARAEGAGAAVKAAVLPTRPAETVRCVQAHALPIRATAA
jgi:cellulose biosynthesis protein BcsE